ncbi:hypothetical protein KI387_032967, partial [Taxus chinensis]
MHVLEKNCKSFKDKREDKAKATPVSKIPDTTDPRSSLVRIKAKRINVSKTPNPAASSHFQIQQLPDPVLNPLHAEYEKGQDCSFLLSSSFSYFLRQRTSPYKLVYGREATLPSTLELNSLALAQQLEFEGTDQREIRMVELVKLEESKNSTMTKIEQHQQATKKWFDRKARPQNFKVGDLVLKWDADRAKPGHHSKRRTCFPLRLPLFSSERPSLAPFFAPFYARSPSDMLECATSNQSKRANRAPNPHNKLAHLYYMESGSCGAAFLANINDTYDFNVTFNGNTYSLPAWSVSILLDCSNVVFNTAKVTTQTTSVQSNLVEKTYATIRQNWKWYNEDIGIWGSDSFTTNGLMEQIYITADSSDYLWYTISIEVTDAELPNSTLPILHVESLGHALHIFVNKDFAGTGFGNNEYSNITLEKPIILKPGRNTLDLLSMTVGLENFGAFYDTIGAGVTGPIHLKGLKSGIQDLSMQEWTYQIGLKGEKIGLYLGNDTNNTIWNTGSNLPINQSMIWYKVEFEAPHGNDPVALDLVSMSKGQAWVNGHGIGRYWPAFLSPKDGCNSSCDYRGNYDEHKCVKNCGQPSQQLYHVPRSWIRSTGNVLVLFEEIGGDPTKITFLT